MKKIYEAKGENKRGFIEVDNELDAFYRYRVIENNSILHQLVLITRTSYKDTIFNELIDTTWCINGIEKSDSDDKNIFIVEPLEKQIDNDIYCIGPSNTKFKKPIELSEKAIFLIPMSIYESMTEEEKNKIDKQDEEKRNIRFYTGEEKFALRLLLRDLDYIYIDIKDNHYVFDEFVDLKKYAEYIEEEQKRLLTSTKPDKTISGYKSISKKYHRGNIKNEDTNYKMISGLTEKVEGTIELDENSYASTDIGKIRENQEDAVLLIKDNDIPDFKMIVVADGMGGLDNGEVASNIVVTELKKWFENLTLEQKECYYSEISRLQDSLINVIGKELETKIEDDTLQCGGTTLVCAIVGKNNTMIVNIGDSRAYKVKNGKIDQLSREDTVVQEDFEKGVFETKEVARFATESNIITQCLGMGRKYLTKPHVEVISNKDYDMILLFTDGVTDCLSDEDIAVVCRTTDKKHLTKMIVEKAMQNDSVIPEEYSENQKIELYIPSGKDNTTAAVIFSDEER